MSSPSLLQRLKERKLVQWGLAYLAGAFVVFQLLDALAEPLGLTPAIQRSILVIVGIGLFVTLVLAWYHGEKGRPRASGLELLMVAALLIVAGVALSVLGRHGDQASVTISREGDDRPGVAVLACDNISPNPEDAFYAEGLHEEILLRLQKVSSLFSVGRASVLWYRANPARPTEIARELQVEFIGECSVRKDEDRIRLTFQLLDGGTGEQLLAENFDRDLTAGNLFEIESEVAQQVAQAIGALLTPEERDRIEARPTVNLEAYDLYLRGRYHLERMTVEDAYSAVERFEAAIENDSTYAAPYAGLAIAWNLLGQPLGAVNHNEAMPKARAAAEKALSLDSTLADAHMVLGLVSFGYDWDWQKAERLFQRAIELDPSSSMAHHAYGVYLADAVGRYEEGIAEGIRAVELDPLSLFYRTGLSEFYFSARQYDRALEEAQKVLDMDPDYDRARGMMMWVFEELEMCEGYLATRREQEVFPGADPGALARQAALEQTCAESGFVGIWQSRLDRRLERIAAGRYVRPSALAEDYARLGKKDEAFEWLERAFDERDTNLAFIHTEPFYDGIRSDPRFQDLLRRMNFPG
jgi:TolB-like protein/Tfp pilus assembly protein PilF